MTIRKPQTLIKFSMQVFCRTAQLTSVCEGHKVVRRRDETLTNPLLVFGPANPGKAFIFFMRHCWIIWVIHGLLASGRKLYQYQYGKFYTQRYQRHSIVKKMTIGNPYFCVCLCGYFQRADGSCGLPYVFLFLRNTDLPRFLWSSVIP